ncbi:DeoR/GlpR transcriptional regulator [Brevibacillus fluminis]|uniref:DeoR/GlpR transcriptional regulator n=1 Tax=Brevibacillus fluminis TaxID=511487 RepID=A0A3M8DNP0_9BACL|nr:DeoR/GlpR family DNA-binding transcription regulator [Brevibacillus fluminis]RNB89703.1 DeoR/GlpR transcriptional regulator [Brevibacillus fluminis]
MSILAVERKKFVLDQLQTSGKVNASELSRVFDVSMETIRRDLDLLEKEGYLKRVHGGAVKSNFDLGEPPFAQRQNVRTASKQKVAKCAAKLINHGDTFVMGGGTTVLEMANHIRGLTKLTIVTNSLPTANVLMDSLNQGLFSGEVIFVGGALHAEQHSSRGALCEIMLDHLKVNKAFVSPGGIALSGLSEYEIEEAAISRKMIGVAKEVIILVDHSKLGIEALCKISPLQEIDVIVCDQEVPNGWESQLEQIEWITAGIEENGGNNSESD